MHWDAVVVGAGLFGSVIAAALRADGRKVLVVDDQRPEAGSRPAACLMKPSWFRSLGRKVSTPSLELLDRLYGVHDLRFRVGPAHATVHWCRPADILSEVPVRGRVRSVRAVQGGWSLVAKPGVAHAEAPVVVVAAGVWTPLLVPVVGGLDGLAGVAFLWPDEKIAEPFVAPWAPYRQVVAFNRGDGLWVSDGTAIRRERWNSEREAASRARCAAAGSFVPPGLRMFGVRPYSRSKPCYLKEQRPGLWVATGGAKNGTIAAGWCAHEIVRRTQ